jgi:hypothetical protein
MTQEEKRIKLAESGGLKVIDVPFIPSQTKSAGCVFTDAARTAWRKCYPNSCGVHGIPDYFNDLNAVHELEKVLNAVQRLQYMDKLGYPHNTSCTFATAAKRCEALGLTLNLWK